MPRTTTKDVATGASASGKVKKTIQKDDAGEQKKRRRNRAQRYTYEVRKGAKKNSQTLQSSAREVLETIYEDTGKRLVEMVKDINPSRATIKALDARCGVGYFVAANCHNAEELIAQLAPIHDRVDEQLRLDREERRLQKGK